MAINQSYSREYEASPSFQWINASSILAGATVNVSWETEDATTQKYLPFNFTRIVNNGEADLWFYANQQTNKAFYVPAGTIISIDRATLPALSSFTIKNADGSTSISANKIIVTNSREGQTSDSVIERLHKRLFSKKSNRVV